MKRENFEGLSTSAPDLSIIPWKRVDVNQYYKFHVNYAEKQLYIVCTDLIRVYDKVLFENNIQDLQRVCFFVF